VASERADLARVIDDATDDQFGRHCTVSHFDRGTLVIRVDVPAVVSIMRRRWAEPLQNALRRAGRLGRTVRRIVFEYGND